MLILDNGSENDDMSIINGDTNHKVWVPSVTHNNASSSRRPNLYGDYASTSTMRSIQSTANNSLATAAAAAAAAANGARNSRPRQMSSGAAAAVPPPPPIGEEMMTTDMTMMMTTMTKKKKKNKFATSGKSTAGRSDNDTEDLSSEMGQRRSSSVFNFPINGHHAHQRSPAPPSIGALHPLPGHPGLMGYPVFNNTRPRPPPMMNGQPPMGGPGGGGGAGGGPPPGAYLVPIPMAFAGGKKSKSSSGFKFGTFSARGKKSKGMLLAPPMAPMAPMAPHPPHPFMFFPGGPGGPVGMPPPHHAPMMAAPAPMALGMPVPLVAPPLSMRRSSSRMTLAAEEPIYMPSAVRPISPTASLQPAHFPHEAYMMQQQYAVPASDLGQHHMMGQHHHMMMMPVGSTMTKPPFSKSNNKKKNKKNTKEANKAMALQQQQQMMMMDADSVGEVLLDADESSVVGSQAGIYRKGHINERAFSYSIRQEHRSRSYSSLANFPPVGGGSDLRERDKKERELIQMVHDLDLSADDLERSEVPIAMYPHHRQPR